MSITHETRHEGYQEVLPFIADVASRVLTVLEYHQLEMTAEEVSEELGVNLNCVRSRLSELKDSGKVVAIGKRKSPRSGVNVAVFRIADQVRES